MSTAGNNSQYNGRKLSLQLCCYNGARFLPYLFASLAEQTYRDWHLYVLDNASNQEEAVKIKEAVDEIGLPISLFRVDKNIGFAGGHNFLFQKHNSEFVQLLNDDAFLEPDYLEKVLKYMESEPECASASGRILRWDFEGRDLLGKGRTTVIDSLGLVVTAYFKVYDWGSGQLLEVLAQSEASVMDERMNKEVFGVSGCLPMYRMEAARKVSPDGDLFDGIYVSYKEDVDLAFRFQAAGYKAAIVNGAVAYHRRSFAGQNRPSPRPEDLYQSYRNHLWLLFTHLSVKSLLGKNIIVIPYEKMKLLHWLVRKPKFIFKAIYDTYNHWPHLKAKRQFVNKLKSS